jgi:GT2 family glycosyltransferase
MHQQRPGNVDASKVSVIVPHYDDLQGLDICLSALAKQSLPKAEFEIIVADNNSPQGLEGVARVVAGRARLISIVEKGAGPARNGGAAAAAGEILAFLDSDCVPEPQWLAEGLAALAGYDVVGGSVAVLVHDPGKLTPAEAFECIFAFDIEQYLERKGFVGSGNLFCRRDVFDRVGGFATGVSEDVDWCHRASAKGFHIGFARKAAVGHPARRSWTDLKRKWARINSQTYMLKLKKRSGKLAWVFNCLLLPISAFVHTPRVLMSDKLSGRQKFAALVILYRIRLWRSWDYCRLLMLGPSLA